MWILWSVVASGLAVTLEWVYRARLFGTWVEGWWALVPVGIALQAALFYSYRGAPGLLAAWSLFFMMNAAARTGVSVGILHEPLSAKNGLGLGLLILGAFLLKG